MPALHHNRVDIGIVRSGYQSEPGLSIECFLPESLVLALPELHPLSAQWLNCLSTLADELFILFPAENRPVFTGRLLPFVTFGILILKVPECV